MKTVTIKMTKTKDCKGSVRFDAPAPPPGAPPNALDNVYVSRIFAPINDAQTIEVEIRVP